MRSVATRANTMDLSHLSERSYSGARRSVPHDSPLIPHRSRISAFTLVEMLVAIGLVVLMMSLFATIFQMSTNAMATQKGIAENDQKARLVLSLLRGDLSNRTTKLVLPFKPNDAADSAYRFDDRKGYFYIAENDPDDDTDDVLQFVVTASDGQDPFYGRAHYFGGTIASDPQQPEFDDGYALTNQEVGSSLNAEVAYFLRRGVLFRRVLLLRQPIIPVDSNAHPYNPQSGATGVADIPLTAYESTGTSNFYSDFDYSAHFDGSGLVFHGVNDLANSIGGALFPLGKPSNRFGFSHTSGLPREFSSQHIDATGGTVNSQRFIGRFTQEETSFLKVGSNPIQSFGYPGRVVAGSSPNPYATGTQLTLDTRTGKVNEYAGGARIAEDILMTSVRRFDVKVFDEGASYGPDGVAGLPPTSNEIGYPGSDDGDFRDLGHRGFSPSGTDLSFYGRGKLNNTSFCESNPLKAGENRYRFDTWHPEVDLDSNPGFDQPPFRAPNVTAPPVGKDPQRPLRAIQIRISFFDQTSQQLRDVTFVQSLE